MSLYPQRVASAVVLVALAGCSEPPPEPPPQPDPVPAPEPPPAPECESLDEACEADADTSVSIAGSAFSFTPPAGWTYAELDNATVAQKGKTGAVIVLSSFEAPAANNLSKKRNELAATFVKLVGLDPKATIKLGAAEQNPEIAGLQMSLWEKPGATRGKSDGAILVFSADAGEREIFGLGYAPRDDTEGTAAILAALKSIQKGSGDESK